MSRRSAPGGGVPAADGDRLARHLARARRTELSAPHRRQAPPHAGRIARRARFVRLSKWTLPAAALLLLGSIALWPEIQRALRVGRSALRADADLRAATGLMIAPEYHGLDGHDRPFMISAQRARQLGPDLVNLAAPIADIFPGGGAWMMATADRGVYGPHTGVLDLSGHVRFYRADGTILFTPVATVDVRRDVGATDAWVHIEGPFGELDAQSGFLASPDGTLQFGGPARLALRDTRNGATATAPAAPTAPQDTGR